MKVLRDGKKVSLSVKLGRLEDNIASSQPSRQRTKKVEFAGMTLSNLEREVAEQFGIDQNIKGVVIVDVKAGSVGEEKGLKKGDVIIQINRIKISSTDDEKIYWSANSIVWVYFIFGISSRSLEMSLISSAIR